MSEMSAWGGPHQNCAECGEIFRVADLLAARDRRRRCRSCTEDLAAIPLVGAARTGRLSRRGEQDDPHWLEEVGSSIAFTHETPGNEVAVIYTPYFDGWSIGIRCEHSDGRVRHVVLTPSSDDSGGEPNVFLYLAGEDPKDESPVTHVCPFMGDDDS